MKDTEKRATINWDLKNQSCFAYLETVISPTAELHFAVLVVKREPRDIYLASGFENTRGNVSTATVAIHHHIGLVGAIKSLISAKYNNV